ncbi:GNAT family N-acetyltransferase [Aquimarina sp. 2201CG5-10]|uniref:GNAT family N-acetyltransferase n=1 Tax=Aquimarina callyspongiae TaxID=3098150 RepID=UPI002AB3FEAE|nr:GNAT family N-acetyltransferase [Aquimarina sp. 2201CG5-10]MDY8138640.1 GNAT family N-acetyltransferase [Aquimarina sp. 2201CG5-10]
MISSRSPIKRLSWDSNFFGIEVGQILLKDEKLDVLKKNNFDLIYVHSDKPLKDFSIHCYDKKVTFKKVLPAQTNIKKLNSVKTYQRELTPSLLNLALISGKYSRFKSDPKLSPYFEELYKLWILNSLSGVLADYVFIYEKENEIIGFVTLKKKEKYYQIGLIATSTQHRGLGIGFALLQKVDETIILEGGGELKVITQIDNDTACQFYKKNNFQIDHLEYIYHLWK